MSNVKNQDSTLAKEKTRRPTSTGVLLTRMQCFIMRFCECFKSKLEECFQPSFERCSSKIITTASRISRYYQFIRVRKQRTNSDLFFLNGPLQTKTAWWNLISGNPASNFGEKLVSVSMKTTTNRTFAIFGHRFPCRQHISQYVYRATSHI